MEDIRIKTHLIITDIHSEFNINWCGKFKDVKPQMKFNSPVFVIKNGDKQCIEAYTYDMKYLEEIAKRLAVPKGREAITEGKSYIYLREINGNDRLMCVVTQKKIKTFAPMYDKVGYYS